MQKRYRQFILAVHTNRQHFTQVCFMSRLSQHQCPSALYHQAEDMTLLGIWAHLDPVLKMIQENHSNVTCLHFFSDGPASQYKQKANFYLWSTVPFKKGFSTTTWNFFEANHGKGAPDGIGRTLKRTADNLVRHGQDLPDAESLFYHLKHSGTVV